MTGIKIYGKPDSKECANLIRQLILKRLSFELFNIENEGPVYEKFLKLTGNLAENPEIPLILDEHDKVISVEDLDITLIM